jgi:hypothetical protein
MQVVINDGDSGLTTRNNLNNMFTELYANIAQPLRLPGISGNTNQAMAADTFIKAISVSGIAGAPILRIGITPNGTELLPDTAIGNSLPIDTEYYFQNAGTLYFTLSGGTINVRIDYIPGYYNE